VLNTNKLKMTIRAFLKKILPSRKKVKYQQNEPSDYVLRESLENNILDQLRNQKSFVLYGPANQGKTYLLSKLLKESDRIYIECNAKFRRSHIYRLILTSIGYSLKIQKRKKKSTTVIAKFGFGGTHMEGTGSSETESTFQQITLDLKNSSEVAHLITKVGKIPYIVLNNFHLLKNKATLLRDLTFFLECTDLRFIIVGTWLNEDYLDIFQPKLKYLLKYVEVPYWTTDDLKTAYIKWYNLQGLNEENNKIIKESNLICQGDISLFKLLHLPFELSESRSEKLADTVLQTISNKVKPNIIKLIELFFSMRENFLSYDTISYEPGKIKNLKFNPAKFFPTDADAFSVEEGFSIRVDSQNEPEYFIEKVEVRKTKIGEIGSYLVRSFHSAIRTKDQNNISISQLIEENEHLKTAIDINLKMVTDIYENIEYFQGKNQLSPFLFFYNARNRAIFIDNKKFYMFLRSISEEEMDDIIEDTLPVNHIYPRKRHHISNKTK
jgi:hypothetical protein